MPGISSVALTEHVVDLIAIICAAIGCAVTYINGKIHNRKVPAPTLIFSFVRAPSFFVMVAILVYVLSSPGAATEFIEHNRHLITLVFLFSALAITEATYGKGELISEEKRKA